jgi:hypothetical protein
MEIVLWHLNRASATEYSGEKFHCSWKVAKNLFFRIYTKELKLRMEIQEIHYLFQRIDNLIY